MKLTLKNKCCGLAAVKCLLQQKFSFARQENLIFILVTQLDTQLCNIKENNISCFKNTRYKRIVVF